MNHDDLFSRPEQPGDDPLDRLLGEARWPEPQPRRVERLWQFWRAQSRARVWRLWPRVAAAAAIVVTGVSIGLIWRSASTPIEVAENPAPPIEELNAGLPTSQPLVEARSANAYEQVIFLAATRVNLIARPAPTGDEPDPLDQAIGELATEPDASLAELAERLLESHGQNVAQLERKVAERIRRGTGLGQLASVRLLAHLGSYRSLPLLSDLMNWPPTRAAAVPGVARLADPVTLARLAMIETDPRLQHELLAALLQRDGPQAVTLFLNFVQDPRTAQAALDSLDGVTEPPVESLFQMLKAANYPLRLAAARVLGRLDGPVISQRLGQMVVRDVNRREAIMALLSCPSDDAVRFLQNAERYPALAADIRRARSQLQTIQ